MGARPGVRSPRSGTCRGELTRGCGGDVHFAIVGDNAGGTRDGVFASAIGHVARMRPDFVMSAGDLVAGYDENGTLEDPAKVEATRDAFDAVVDELGVPFHHVPGTNDVLTHELSVAR